MRVREVRTDEIGLLKEDTPAPWVRYVGRSDSMVASDSDPVWQIMRVSKEGSVVTSTYAKKGSYVCAWEDRETYFPPIETTYVAYQADMSTNFVSDNILVGNSVSLAITVSWSGVDSQNGEFLVESSADGVTWLGYPDSRFKVTLVPSSYVYEINLTGLGFFRVTYAHGNTLTGLADISYTTKGERLSVT